MGFAKMAGDVILELFLHLIKFVPGDKFVLSIRHLRKALNDMGIFIKARIIIGCIGVGYFLSMAIEDGNPRTIISTVFFAILIIYGVISLQNKYLSVKK